jgi:hypothetical protein
MGRQEQKKIFQTRRCPQDVVGIDEGGKVWSMF